MLLCFFRLKHEFAVHCILIQTYLFYPFLLLKALILHLSFLFRDITVPFLAWLGFGRQNLLNWIVPPYSALNSNLFGLCLQLVVLQLFAVLNLVLVMVVKMMTIIHIPLLKAYCVLSSS